MGVARLELEAEAEAEATEVKFVTETRWGLESTEFRLGERPRSVTGAVIVTAGVGVVELREELTGVGRARLELEPEGEATEAGAVKFVTEARWSLEPTGFRLGEAERSVAGAVILTAGVGVVEGVGVARLELEAEAEAAKTGGVKFVAETRGSLESPECRLDEGDRCGEAERDIRSRHPDFRSHHGVESLTLLSIVSCVFSVFSNW